MPLDTDNLPARIPRSRVAALLGFSVSTLHTRCSTGAIDLKPVDRGRELLYARADVLRVLGITEGTPASPVAEPAPKRPIFDALAFRETRLNDRFKKRPRPFPRPADPARQEDYLAALDLWLTPGLTVEPAGDRWKVMHHGRLLPIGAKGPVHLTRQIQILICDQNRALRQGAEPAEVRF